MPKRTTDSPPHRARQRRGPSPARKRGLLRLLLLVALVSLLVVLASRALFTGGSHRHLASKSAVSDNRTPPVARTSSVRLPGPLHGATAAVSGERILVIGGADRADVSTDRVLALDPRTGRVSPQGTLAQPLHDAAAVTLNGRTLVFGGGASTTYDTAQALTPGGSARQIGHLPVAASDLSAVTAGGAAYVLGGYDGRAPVASVFRTMDGQSFATAGRLPTAVRYTAAAALGNRIYAFGGELGTGSDTAEIQQFVISTGQTSVVGRLPRPVSHASAVVLDGSIYLVGGRLDGAASAQILRFDPSRNVVHPAGRLRSPVFDAAAATASAVGYLVGGIGSRGSSVDSVQTLSENP